MKRITLTIVLFLLTLTLTALAQPQAGNVNLFSDPWAQTQDLAFDGDEILAGYSVSTRRHVNLSGCTIITLSANIYSTSGTGTYLVEYSTDNGTTWAATGASVTVSAAGLTVGTPATLATGARMGPVILRAVTDSTGNSAQITSLDVVFQ